MEFENLTEDGEIQKKILKEGIGESGSDGIEVYFFYIMRELDGSFITGTETQHFRAVVGQGQLNTYLERALKSMKLGERSVFRVKNAAEIGRPNGIELEVEVIRFGNRRTGNWELTSEQREQRATTLRNQGNELIRAKDFAGARDSYEEGLNIVREDSFDDLKQAFLNNLSLAYLKLNEFEACEGVSSQALELQPNNVKLYYRRGLARVQLQRFDDANADFEAGLRIEPDNAEIKKELETVRARRKERQQKDKEVYKKMFSE